MTQSTDISVDKKSSRPIGYKKIKMFPINSFPWHALDVTPKACQGKLLTLSIMVPLGWLTH